MSCLALKIVIFIERGGEEEEGGGYVDEARQWKKLDFKKANLIKFSHLSSNAVCTEELVLYLNLVSRF
jgi:hypothetical protein